MKNIFKKQINYSSVAISILAPIMVFLVILSFSFREMTKEVNLLSADITKTITQENVSGGDQIPDGQGAVKPDGSDGLNGEGCEPAALSVKAIGRYYSAEGDQLGVGPLPPAVDIPTNVWIFFETEGSGGRSKNFSMTAQLPENVVWTDKKSVLAGKLSFGQIGKRVVWEIGQVNERDGVYRAGFEVSLIPTQADLGKVLGLITDIKFSAIEQSCQSKIGGSLDDITTDLIFDALASGKGRVVEFPTAE